jgi:hypothetical protein
MKKRININKKSKDWKARYPLVEIHWLDILSDPSWQSLKGVMQMELPTCVTKGHLVSQTKGVTRVFGDHSLNKENSNRPLLQRALKIYSGSIVREPITSDTEPLATFFDPIDWIALKDLLFTAGEPRTSDKSRTTSA